MLVNKWSCIEFNEPLVVSVNRAVDVRWPVADPRPACWEPLLVQEVQTRLQSASVMNVTLPVWGENSCFFLLVPVGAQRQLSGTVHHSWTFEYLPTRAWYLAVMDMTATWRWFKEYMGYRHVRSVPTRWVELQLPSYHLPWTLKVRLSLHSW